MLLLENRLAAARKDLLDVPQVTDLLPRRVRPPEGPVVAAFVAEPP
jgi:hypothetical protein